MVLPGALRRILAPTLARRSYKSQTSILKEILLELSRCTTVGPSPAASGHLVGERLKRHDWAADINLDHAVGKQRNQSGVAVQLLSVFEYDDASLVRPHLIRPKWLVPYVEELTECELLLRRGFHVDDSVGNVRVQPVEAVVDSDVIKGSLRIVLHGLGLRYANTRWQALHVSVEVDRHVDMDVVLHHFFRLCPARDAINASAAKG